MKASCVLASTICTSLMIALMGVVPAATAGEPPEPIDAYLETHREIEVADAAIWSSSAAIVVEGQGASAGVLGATAPAEGAGVSPLAGCDYRNAVFTSLSAWQDSVDGCGIIGYDWTARYAYSWTQDKFAWNSGPSCVQGRGYSTNRTVSTPVWVNAGCGGSGSVSAFIGNRATVAKVRGHVNAVAKIGYVRWK